MNWYFFHAYGNSNVEISESPKNKNFVPYLEAYSDAYLGAGGPTEFSLKIPDPFYAFLLKKNPFRSDIGHSDIILHALDIYLISSKVLAIFEQFNIHFEKSNVELVNGEKYGITEKYYWIKLLDIINPSLDIEASTLSYGVDQGKQYISKIDHFKFLETINVDLFIPRDLLMFNCLVCSEPLKNALIDSGINCIKFDLVEDMLAVKDKMIPYPDALELKQRPPTAQEYLAQRQKRRDLAKNWLKK